MKKIILIGLLAVLQTFAWAGNGDFEGNITFGINLEGTGTDILKAMLPSNYVYVIKNNQMLFRMEGGMVGGMIGDVLINANDGNNYMLKHKENTAYRVESESSGNDAMPEGISVVALDETQSILGYTCNKYKVTITKDGETVEQYLWATTDIKISGQDVVSSSLSGNIFFNGVKGFPLKVESTINKMGLSFKMIMTATSINLNTVDKSVFALPSSYKVKDFDPTTLMGF